PPTLVMAYSPAGRSPEWVGPVDYLQPSPALRRFRRPIFRYPLNPPDYAVSVTGTANMTEAWDQAPKRLPAVRWLTCVTWAQQLGSMMSEKCVQVVKRNSAGARLKLPISAGPAVAAQGAQAGNADESDRQRTPRQPSATIFFAKRCVGGKPICADPPPTASSAGTGAGNAKSGCRFGRLALI